MLDPLSQRTAQNGERVDRAGFSLPTAPPSLPSGSAFRQLRVLPCSDGPEESGSDVAPAPEAATSGAMQLRRELEAVRNELDALQDMLEELPAILERKFQLRLRGLLEQEGLLIARNESLRERLLALGPAPEPIALPEGAATAGPANGFLRSLQRALGRQGLT